MAAIALHQRAQQLVANPAEDQINAIARELQGVNRGNLAERERQIVGEAFEFLAQARQALEYRRAPPAAQDQAVRAPDLVRRERLIDPLPQNPPPHAEPPVPVIQPGAALQK